MPFPGLSAKTNRFDVHVSGLAIPRFSILEPRPLDCRTYTFPHRRPAGAPAASGSRRVLLRNFFFAKFCRLSLELLFFLRGSTGPSGPRGRTRYSSCGENETHAPAIPLRDRKARGDGTQYYFFFMWMDSDLFGKGFPIRVVLKRRNVAVFGFT